MRLVFLAFVVAIVACGTAPTKPVAPKATKILVDVDDKGVILGGNDAVAYAKDNAATPGNESITSSFGGATYQFASAENKAAFDAGPSKSAPQFGGYCAFAASQNRLSVADPSVFLIRDGQLLVFTNEDYKTQFLADPAGNKAKADANWPGLIERYGK